MRTSAVLARLGARLAVVVAVVVATAAAAATAGASGDPVAEARVEAGLPPLREDAGLAALAAQHALEMAAAASLAHTDLHTLSGGVLTRAQRVSENVGVGASRDQVLATFLSSAQHRANALGDFDVIGTGVAVSVDGRVWVDQLYVKTAAQTASAAAPAPAVAAVTAVVAPVAAPVVSARLSTAPVKAARPAKAVAVARPAKALVKAGIRPMAAAVPAAAVARVLHIRQYL